MPFCGTSRKTTLFQKTLQEFVAGKIGISDLFKIPQVSETYVCKQLNSLNIHKAKGTDDIGPYFFKLAAEIISPSLTYILNRSIMCGVFPDSWKLAHVTPLFKKGKKENVENNRPISTLCTLSKILERHVHQEFYSYLTNANLLLSEQSAFQPQRSSESSLTSITDSWISSMNEGKMIGALFIDLQKAFDSTDHSILLGKLKVYGGDELTLKWFTSYLADRHQKVKYNETSSEFQTIKCGVPQGFILGPLLFIIFINVLPLHLIHCRSDFYADDTTISAVGKNLGDIEKLLNIDAENIYQ